MKVVKVKRLASDAVMPRRAHADDAGYDLVAVSRTVDENGCMVYGTGLAFEIPEGMVGLLFPRSSVANRGLSLSNCVGVVDSGYRGEVTFKFRPVDTGFVEMRGGDYMLSEVYHPKVYAVGDRIGQLVLVSLPDVAMIESDELSRSERGEGGYGSTGR